MTIKFEDLPKEEQQRIREQIWDEQRPLVKKEVKAEAKEVAQIRAKHLGLVRDKTEFQEELSNHYGTFFFSNYAGLEDIFTIDNRFEASLVFKFLYLSTYADYDGVLHWGQEFRGEYTGNMTVKDLPEVLGVSRQMATTIRTKLFKIGALTTDIDGTLSVNTKLCFRGTLTKANRQDSTRAYDKCIRELYKASTTKEHVRLGKVVQLLPYVNVFHNVLCLNTAEKNIKKLEVLRAQDIARILGEDVSHTRRMEKDITKTRVGDEILLGQFIGGGNHCFVVNPRLFYKGNDIKDLRALANLFLVPADDDLTSLLSGMAGN